MAKDEDNSSESFEKTTAISETMEIQDRETDYTIDGHYQMSELPKKEGFLHCSKARRGLGDLRTMLSERYNSYYWRHFFVWTLLALLISGPLYATARQTNMEFIDALFYVVSAITSTGMSPTDLSKESLATQIMLIFCMLISGAVFESLIPLMVRLWVTTHKMKDEEDLHREDENGNPLKLTPQQRSEERRISFILLLIIACYYLLVVVVSFLVTGLYFQFSSVGSAVMESNELNAWWFSLFQAVSCFNNCGLGLLFDSLVQLNSQILPLIFYGALILLGNTAYPIFLRALIFALERFLRRRGSPVADDLQKILDKPRSFMTHLFPATRTWLLLGILVFFISLQTVLMVALPNNKAFPDLSDGYIFANAMFQSIAVRAAGVNSILVSNLSMEALIVTIIMMYIASYPNIVSIRSTNEDQSKNKRKTRHQLRRLLMQDALWVIAPWFLVCTLEGYSSFANGFKTLFETVSAYGNVGLSLGLFNQPFSFSGIFSIPSKLVIIVTMLVGRHRGMPDRFDAVFLHTFTRPYEVKIRHTNENL